MNTAAQDALLETLDDPLHRQIIENYRRHALLEVSGNWEPIFAPEMTVDEPVYRLNFGGMNGGIIRNKEVHDMYRGMCDTGAKRYSRK